MAVSPNTVIHSVQAIEGMISTETMNSRTVRPRDRHARDEHADEGRPRDPPCPVEGGPALQEVGVVAAHRVRQRRQVLQIGAEIGVKKPSRFEVSQARMPPNIGSTWSHLDLSYFLPEAPDWLYVTPCLAPIG
jgi:hypothetical protein